MFPRSYTKTEHIRTQCKAEKKKKKRHEVFDVLRHLYLHQGKGHALDTIILSIRCGSVESMTKCIPYN